MATNQARWIAILGGGILTIPMYQACKRLGLNVLALEQNLSAPGLSHADSVLSLDLKNPDEVRRAARRAAAKHPVAGVVTCGADIEVAVAVFAETLGLPGIPVEVAEACNDKVRMRRRLDGTGLSDTRWAEARSPQEALDAAEAIGYPCYLKPVDNCGSRGCKRIESPEDMSNWWDAAIDYSVSGDGRAIVEEYLVGPRQTIEMIVFDGQVHLVSIIDTHYIYDEPDRYPFGHWPVETGLNTTELPDITQRDLFEHSSRIVRAMGVDFGPVKVDTTLTKKGIRTIELTARLSGGFHCQYATPLAYGTDEISAVAKLAVGQGLCLDDIRHKFDRAAVVLSKFPRPGRIVSISGVDEALSISGVRHVFLTKTVGDIAGPYRNSTDRVGFVIADGANLGEARQAAERGVQTLDIRTTQRPLGEARAVSLPNTSRSK